MRPTLKPNPMEYALYAVICAAALLIPFYLTGLFLQLAATMAGV